MAEKPLPSQKQSPSLPSPDVVRDLVKVGIEQIRVRQQELDLQERENQRQYDFAWQALAIQAEDRRGARELRRRRDIDRYVFVAVLFATFVGFIIALSYMGKDEIAKETSKLAASFIAGGLSGYGVGTLRARRIHDIEEEDAPRPSAGS